MPTVASQASDSEPKPSERFTSPNPPPASIVDSATGKYPLVPSSGIVNTDAAGGVTVSIADSSSAVSASHAAS